MAASMNDAYFAEIERLLRNKYTGSIVLHVNQGTIKDVDTNSKIRLKATGPVQIHEQRKGA